MPSENGKSKTTQTSANAKTTATAVVPGIGAKPKFLTFSSAGHKIRTEWFYPPGTTTGAHATLIVLHGSGGLEPAGGFFRDLAAQIARSGTTVVIVHYMDRSGITCANNAQMSSCFQQWLKTIHDAVDFVQQQPDIDAKRICLFGHSLGAQLALHEAATDPRIHCVIDMAGCFVLPSAKITHMPDILILQGAADKVVTLKREKGMVAVLNRCGSKYDEHIFPGVDHMFQNMSTDKLVKLSVDFLKN
jgi:dienelactone hydrolase